MANSITVFMLTVVVGCCGTSLTAEKKSDNCKEKWKLIFRGISGNGESINQAFTRTQPTKCKLELGCLPENVNPGFLKRQKRHLTSPLVRKWTNLNIDKVKMELYKKGKVVVSLIFGAHGSYYHNWFSQNRLLNSNFHDLYRGHCVRYFGYHMISYHYLMISQDTNCMSNYDERNYFWLAIVDRNYNGSKCPWSKQSSYPAFLYAPKNERAQFNKKKYKLADEMAIYISLSKY